MDFIFKVKMDELNLSICDYLLNHQKYFMLLVFSIYFL